MANISQITLPNSNTYTIKDPIFRGTNNVTAPIFATSTAYRKYDMFWSGDVLYVVLSAITASNTKSAATLLSDGTIKAVTIGKNFGDLWDEISDIIGGAVVYRGTSSDEHLTDGSTTQTISLTGGGSLTASTGDMVIKTTTPPEEFIWDGSKWNSLGTATGAFGALAYKSSASGPYDKTTSVTYTAPTGSGSVTAHAPNPTTKFLSLSYTKQSLTAGTAVTVPKLADLALGGTTTFITELDTTTQGGTVTADVIGGLSAITTSTPSISVGKLAPQTTTINTLGTRSTAFQVLADDVSALLTSATYTSNTETLTFSGIANGSNGKIETITPGSSSPVTSFSSSDSGTIIGSVTLNGAAAFLTGTGTPALKACYTKLKFSTSSVSLTKGSGQSIVPNYTITDGAASISSSATSSTGAITYVESDNGKEETLTVSVGTDPSATASIGHTPTTVTVS